jgi:hypothetical protein
VSSLLIPVVVRELRHVQLTTERGEVEIVVGAEQQVAAARIRRIGVEDAVTIAQADTRVRLLTLEKPGLAPLLDLRLAPVVVLDRRDDSSRVTRHVHEKVENASKSHDIVATQGRI